MCATLDHAFNIKILLWHFDPSTHSDKIWGVVDVNGISYNFWGRRADLSSAANGKLSFKLLGGTWPSHDITERAREKQRQGYQEIDCSRTADGTYPGLEKLHRGFVEEFAKLVTFIRAFGSATGPHERLGRYELR